MSKKYIAKKLKEYREKSGISINEVANKFEKSIKTIYAWESGQGQPDADTLIQLCLWYGITDFKVLSADVIRDVGSVSEEQKELVKNFETLNELGQHTLLEQSRMMCTNSNYKKSSEHIPANLTHIPDMGQISKDAQIFKEKASQSVTSKK